MELWASTVPSILNANKGMFKDEHLKVQFYALIYHTTFLTHKTGQNGPFPPQCSVTREPQFHFDLLAPLRIKDAAGYEAAFLYQIWLCCI